ARSALDRPERAGPERRVVAQLEPPARDLAVDLVPALRAEKAFGLAALLRQVGDAERRAPQAVELRALAARGVLRVAPSDPGAAIVAVLPRAVEERPVGVERPLDGPRARALAPRRARGAPVELAFDGVASVLPVGAGQIVAGHAQ